MNDDLVEIRKNILKMAHYSCASHVGSALSCVDILYAIYKTAADITLKNVHSINRDKVILSKGHASIAMYATLSQFSLLNKELLKKYYIDNGLLPGHLDKESCPAIDCSAGSLGHGLPIGVGMALANKDKNVFVIMGDGETQEGSVWESMMFCGKERLTNLTIIIDNNNLQGFCHCNEIVNYTKLVDTLNNFGLDASGVDGHNISELEYALNRKSNRTKVIIAKTIKGKGVSFMENQFIWHYKSPNDEQLDLALKELNR